MKSVIIFLFGKLKKNHVKTLSTSRKLQNISLKKFKLKNNAVDNRSFYVTFCM